MRAIVRFRTTWELTAMLCAALALSLSSGLTPTARAATSGDDPAANEAKRHYEEGTKAFNLGEYPRAIAEFKATYNAKPDPLLLYNIAQSYRLAGDAGQALFFYKSFLRNMPSATNRKEVEGRIKTLEKQVADQRKDPSTAPPPVVVPALPATSPSTVGVTPPPPPTSSASASDLSPPATAAPPSATGTEASTGSANEAARNAIATPGAAPSKAPEPTVDLTTPVKPEPEPSRPIYKKWWFWAGTVGAVLIIGGVAAANAKKGPNTALGIYDPTFMPPPNP